MSPAKTSKKATSKPKARRPSTSRTTPEAMPVATSQPNEWVDDSNQARDYLVIYDEPDEDGLPHDDSLFIDLEGRRSPTLGELDVEQKLDLQLSNKTNRVGTFGFVLAILGSLAGLVLMIAFAITYPARWYDDNLRVSGDPVVKSMVFFAIITLLLLIAGTVLTHYGRRIQAHGNLSAVRIVEKGRQSRTRIG